MSVVLHSPRFLAAFYAAVNRSRADTHGHVIHGGVLRQGKCVDRLDLLFEGVLKFLGYNYAGKESADLGFDIGVFQGADSRGLSFGADDVERPLSIRSLTPDT